MATKEEIEGELKELRERHEKLKLQKKEVETKLELARQVCQILTNYLDLIPDVGYRQAEKEPDFPEPQNEIQ